MHKFITAMISESAVEHNLQLLRAHIGENVKMYPAVKADCYGHGLELLLGVISKVADGLCVATPSSAMQLRYLGYDGPILLFSSACAFSENIKRQAIAELISADITQTVVDKNDVDILNEVAIDLGVKTLVHLKIDTGMTRAGVIAIAVPKLIDIINKSDGLKLTGIYTHFATADETDLSFAEKQLAIFKDIIAKSDISDDVMLHAANSAAIMRLPNAHLDMVRPGLAVYGYSSCDSRDRCLSLKPCLRVTAPLIQVKDVPAGSSCGYGLTYTCDKDSRIGRVPIGYGDGYFRCLSNKSTVRINGKDVPLRGRVSMDQIIIDLTDVPNVAVGDEVEIISDDNLSSHSVENLAGLAGTIPYEITCALRSERIEKRSYYVDTEKS
jgi:alanine racemase